MSSNSTPATANRQDLDHEDETVTAQQLLSQVPRLDMAFQGRVVEALLFAASEPLSMEELAACLPENADIEKILAELAENYANRGVNLVKVAGKWSMRTAEDLSFLLRREAVEQKKLSKAALETLAIIAYHQPVTRAEIEEIRGVSVYRGTLDTLLQLQWIKLRGRRRVPGRPVTYGTTEEFLVHFGLNANSDLPGFAELSAAGLLDANLPSDFAIPQPGSDDVLGPDEDPIDDNDEPELEMHLPDLEAYPDDGEGHDEDDLEEALAMDRPQFLSR